MLCVTVECAILTSIIELYFNYITPLCEAVYRYVHTLKYAHLLWYTLVLHILWHHKRSDFISECAIPKILPHLPLHHFI